MDDWTKYKNRVKSENPEIGIMPDAHGRFHDREPGEYAACGAGRLHQCHRSGRLAGEEGHAFPECV